MSHLFLQPITISSLNNLASLPLPISRFILSHTSPIFNGSLSFLTQPRILKLLRDESIEIDLHSAISSLTHLLKTSKKQGLPPKQLTLLLTQNTLLSQQIVTLILSIYSSQPSPCTPTPQLQWSAINLRRSKSNKLRNKLYMKIQLDHQPLTMTLGQFRILSQELSRVQTALH